MPQPGQIPEDPPEAADLAADAEGGIEVPSQAPVGSNIVVQVSGVQAGKPVGVWLFSEPTYLGTHVVNESGQVTVTLPADVTGEHRIAVYEAGGDLVGWADITIVPQSSPAPSPEPTITPSDDATPQPTEQERPEAGLPATGVSSEASVGSWLVAAIGGVIGLAMLRRRVGPEA